MRNGVDRVTITTLTENYVDMLLPDSPKVTRAGLTHHFDPKRLCPVAENGIALFVEVSWDRYTYRGMFDTGMTGPVIQHNADALDIDLRSIDHVVISHGHPDHYGGLLGVLDRREAPVPISLHPDAFMPRYVRLASGQLAPFYNLGLSEQRIRQFGGAPILHTGPLEVGPGLIATGAIPREVDFEAPPTDLAAPNAMIQIDSEGHACADIVPDDQALLIEVGTDGLVVLSGCGHAGIVNTIAYAMQLTGRNRIVGVLGGFHLGFPGTPDSKTEKTIEAFRDIEIETLCPMHCTGMRSIMRLADAFPETFLLNCTGAQVSLHARRSSGDARVEKAGGAASAPRHTPAAPATAMLGKES